LGLRVRALLIEQAKFSPKFSVGLRLRVPIEAVTVRPYNELTLANG
jgi:hypothetical protein